MWGRNNEAASPHPNPLPVGEREKTNVVPLEQVPLETDAGLSRFRYKRPLNRGAFYNTHGCCSPMQ
jgi:hypothetical protein